MTAGGRALEAASKVLELASGHGATVSVEAAFSLPALNGASSVVAGLEFSGLHTLVTA